MATTPRQFLIRTSSRFCSTVTGKKSIEIPQYKRRAPTDLLKAIAGTVGRDFNAPLYKYHDDPYLIPHSNLERDKFALAKESGKRTARWLRDAHPEYFLKHDEAPVIKKLIPKFTLRHDDKIDLPTFEHFMKLEQLEECKKVFSKLMEMNGDKSIVEVLGAENTQNYLEILCASNGQELPDTDLYEEAMRDLHLAQITPMKSWKSDGEAETIFASLKNPSEEAYCAMIKGACKFWDKERAYELYHIALEKGFNLDTQTFNALIQVLAVKAPVFSSVWDDAREICQKMAEKGHKPNISTMNGLMATVATCREFKLAQDTCLGVLNDFRQLGIYPSLGTYYWVLQCFYFKRGQYSSILVDIIDDIQNRPEVFDTVVDPRDSSFFACAMECATRHLESWTLAQKIHEILMTGQNYKLVGSQAQEHSYFNHFFEFAMISVSMDEFFQIFDKYVPNFYVPKVGTTKEIIKATLVMNRLDLIPRIWSDVISMRTSWVPEIIELVLESSLTLLEEGSECDEQLRTGLGNVAKDMWNKISQIENRSTRAPRRQQSQYSVNIASDVILLLMYSKEVKFLENVFVQMTENHLLFDGIPEEELFVKLIEFSQENELSTLTNKILSCANTYGISEKSLLEKTEQTSTDEETNKEKE